MNSILRIIMLEDNLNDAELIQDTLKRAGIDFEANVVSDSKSFIHSLNFFSPDVILSDHQLPQFNSMKALEIAQDISPFVPFILVTGTVSEEFATLIIKAGADDYMLKENLKRLPTAIEQAIEKKKNQRLLLVAQQEKEFDHNNLTALINNTDDLMWSVDREFRLITCNLAFGKMVKHLSGKEPKKGNDIRALATSLEQFERFEKYYKKAFSGEVFSEIEYTAEPEFWSEISYYPIRKDNIVIGTACYSRDITLRKKEERHLKLLESVITNATDSVLITDASLDEPGPQIIYVNDAFTRMTGYSRGEVIGQTPRMLQGPLTDKDTLARLKECMGKQESCEIEVINYRKNGEPFWINIAIAPVLDNDGIATHFIAIEKDVSERLNTLESIKEQNRKLKEIAWMQSHEVRGPLARILGLIDLIQNYSQKEEKPELISYLLASGKELDAVIRKIVAKSSEVE